MGVRVRSGGVLVSAIEGTGSGETGGGGVEGGGEGKTPFTSDGDVGSGICAGDTCSGLVPGSDSAAGFGVGSGEPTLGP